MPNSRVELAIAQITAAREYTLSLLDDIPNSDWFVLPDGCPTHIAWQVGHLAMAQYGLCLFRIRGRSTEDKELMSSTFRKTYSKSTIPDPDPVNNPSPDAIRATFDNVFQQSLRELPTFSEEQINAEVDRPYAVEATNFGGLIFCAHHEMLHAGQIGLIRRLLGRDPVR